MRLRALVLVLPVALLACIDEEGAKKAVDAIWQGGPKPDSMPVLLNREPPFKYPLSLWATRVQGNVVLRIHIDSTGSVRPESTIVVESSGYPELDSAAVTGSEQLRFRPALLRNEAMALSIQLPVFFRHPEATPLPGDTVLHRDSGSGIRDSVRRPPDSTRTPNP